MTRKKIVELLAAYASSDSGNDSVEEVRLKYPNSWKDKMERAKKYLEFNENPKYYIRRFIPDQMYLMNDHKFKKPNDKTQVRTFNSYTEAYEKMAELVKNRKRSEYDYQYTIDKVIHDT